MDLPSPTPILDRTSPASRERIVRAAADLLVTGGREAVTSRAVSAAAGVQSPTIYRQFGDMRSLLDAVVEQGFTSYLHDKVASPMTNDPVNDVRRGWDLHVAFGLENPALYALMYGEARAAPAAALASQMLESVVTGVARAGRLRVGVPAAMAMLHAAGVGVVLTLIATPTVKRDPDLSAATREAVLAAITTAPSSSPGHPDDRGGVVGSDRAEDSPERLRRHAVALRADLTETVGTLTHGERTVLTEWLDRIIESSDGRLAAPSER